MNMLKHMLDELYVSVTKHLVPQENIFGKESNLYFHHRYLTD